jgi:hypothetical protein
LIDCASARTGECLYEKISELEVLTQSDFHITNEALKCEISSPQRPDWIDAHRTPGGEKEGNHERWTLGVEPRIRIHDSRITLHHSTFVIASTFHVFIWGASLHDNA